MFRVNVILFKRLVVGEGVWIFCDVIMFFIFLELMYLVKREEYMLYVLVLFCFLVLCLFYIICYYFDCDGRIVMLVIKFGFIWGKFKNFFKLNGWNLGENFNFIV